MCIRARIALVLKLDYLSMIVCQQLHVLLCDAHTQWTRASCTCPGKSRVRSRYMALPSAASKRQPRFQSSYICLYRENAIAIESEARDPNCSNVYYVTM